MHKKVIICVCLAAFLFGTMEVALKMAGSQVDPVQMTFLRFLIGALMLAPFAIAESKKREYRMVKADYFWLFLVGCMGIPISMVCFQLGVIHSNAATAAVLMCMNPIFTIVLAHFFTGEKLTKIKGLSFVLCLIAGFLLIRPWDVQPGNTVAGIVLMLVAASTFSAYTVMGKRSIGRIGIFTQTCLSFLMGSSVLLVVLLLIGRPVISGVVENWAIIAYCGIFVTGLGYLFYFLAIRWAGASTGSIAFFIKPAIAPLLAVLVLHETLYWNSILGIVILIFASFITLHPAAQKKTN